jgi:hypothetical protein
LAGFLVKKINDPNYYEWNKTEPFQKYIYERSMWNTFEGDLFDIDYLFSSKPSRTTMTRSPDSFIIGATCSTPMVGKRRHLPDNPSKQSGGDSDPQMERFVDQIKDY